MKLRLFLMLLLLVVLGACTSLNLGKLDPRNVRATPPVQEERAGGARGVIISFLPHLPEDVVVETFSLGLGAENYLPSDTFLDIRMTAVPTYPGDFASTSFSASVDPAQLDGNSLKKATSFSSGSLPLDLAGRLILGPYRYTTDKQQRKVTFFADYRYTVDADLSGHFCVANPALSKSRCGSDERLGEGSLGPLASHLPITVSEIKKTLIAASGSSANVKLDFTVQNKGSGDIDKQASDEVLLDLSFDTGALGLTCSSPNSRQRSGGPSLLLKLGADGKATATCMAEVGLGEEEVLDSIITMHLQYGYRTIVEKTITLKPFQEKL